LALSTVQQELQRMSAIGVISSARRGKYKFYRANFTHALAEHLSRVVQISQRTPAVDASSLRPQPVRRKIKKRTRVRPPSIRPDRQPNWNLFRHH
jgi:hypothetical protein